MVESRRGNEVLARILPAQQGFISLQLLNCFTWNIPPRSLREAVDHAAARRLAAT
jgi:hypothetical protein